MSWEIREVALGWEHPRGDTAYHRDVFIPLWNRSSLLWEINDRRENPADYEDDGPDLSLYMPSWPEGTPLGYCMYETISEGTPVSPVFPAKDGLRDWLVTWKGYSPAAADEFVRTGWAPSLMSGGGLPGVVDGITAAGLSSGGDAR